MVDFNTIPNDLRVPLFYAEVDGSRAGTFDIRQPLILIGHKLDTGTAAEDLPHLIGSADHAGELAGRGSMLHAMARRAFENDPTIETWILPVAAPDGTAAEATVAIAGTATQAGVLPVYAGGRKVSVSVSVGDTAAEVATALAAAVQADKDGVATAAAVDGTVTLTARHDGVVYNGLPVEIAPLGSLGGETVPAGLTVTPSAFADGAGVPDIAAGLAALGDDIYDFIVSAFTDTAALDDLDDFLSGVSGRWSYASQLYGHAFAAKVDTLSNLASFGNARNGEHVTVSVLRACPHPVWEIAAASAARAAQSLRIDPARPLQTLTLSGIRCRASGQRFTMQERNTLLYDGVAPLSVDDRGTVRLERVVTTYQENPFGQPDNAWLDVTTPYTIMEVLRRPRRVVESEFGRMKLANDDQPIAAGSATTTPKLIRGRIIAEYEAMMIDGLVENLAEFKRHLVVERSTTNPNRVDVLFPPDLVNGLMVVAVLAQYRLQYPAAA
ncbi:MAG: phage tail sheath subtilisin-like domain-containing protein [Alphaproteobacteria bacterium]